MSSKTDFVSRNVIGSGATPLGTAPPPDVRLTPAHELLTVLRSVTTKVVLINGEQLIVDGDMSDVWDRLAKQKAGEEVFFSERFSLADTARQVVIARDKVLYLEENNS